jgi:hypothetical protein
MCGKGEKRGTRLPAAPPSPASSAYSARTNLDSRGREGIPSLEYIAQTGRVRRPVDFQNDSAFADPEEILSFSWAVKLEAKPA